MTRLIARKGEKVTRENGEYICRVAHDIYSGDVPKVDDFDDWQIEKPKPYTAFPAYEVGKSYVRHTSGFPLLADVHLERGWARETSPPERSE